MPMVAQNPDNPNEPIEVVQPKSKFNTVEAYPFTVATNYIKFKISNYYMELNYIDCDWSLYKSIESSVIIKRGTKSILKGKSSAEIEVTGLQSNTKYTLKLEPFKIIEEPGDTTRVALPVVLKNFSTNKTDEEIVQTQVEAELAGQSGNFNQLYPSDVKGTKISGYGLNITNVSADNRYYRNYNYLLGCNYCTPFGSWITGFVLPNCVGYAHGRVREIWGRAAEKKVIKKDSSGWYLTSTGRRITGEVNSEYSLLWTKVPPACDAWGWDKHGNPVNWWVNWPNNDGWSKSSKPALGAVILWEDAGAGYGHVAVVEQVDYSTGDIIVSASDYGGSVGYVRKYTKSSNYGSGGGLKFKGFLISPVCQIPSALNSSFEDDILINVNVLSIEDHDQATYNEIAHAHQTKLNEALSINDHVEIQWFGNTKADGKGRNIGNLTLIGRITNINYNALYPYEVTINKKVAGYYPRSSLIKTTAPLSTSLYSSIDGIQTNGKVAVTAQVMTDGLRIRSGPGTNYDELGYITNGTVVNIYETQTNGKYDWYKISKDHEQWIANAKDEHGNYWVQTLSASLVNDGETQYKKYRFTTQVKVRTSPEYKADGSNVSDEPYKEYGEVVNVYQVNAQGQKPSAGEQTYWMYPPTGYDADEYIWRRIDDNKWVADESRDGSWEVPLSYNPSPASPVNQTKKLYLNPGIELKVRDFPGLSGNEVDRLSPSTEGYEIGPWYNQQSNNGYTWYRISQYEDRWIADKYDTDIQGHYVTIK